MLLRIWRALVVRKLARWLIPRVLDILDPRQDLFYGHRLGRKLAGMSLAGLSCLPIAPGRYREFLAGISMLLLNRDLESVLSRVQAAARMGFPALGLVLTHLARGYLNCGDYERSRALLTQAHDLDPANAYPTYNLALLCLVFGDEAKAKVLIMAAIAADKRYAMAHQNMAARYERDVWLPTELDSTGDAELHLYDAYHHIGQLLVNAGDARGGIRMFGAAMKLQQKLAMRYFVPKALIDALAKFESFDPAKPLRILPYEWVTQIGHIGMIDALLKMERLGMRPAVNWVLLAPRRKVANPAFLECWKPYLTIVQEQALIDELFPYQRICGEQFNCYVDDQGNVIDWSDAASRAFIEWDRQGRGPLIAIPDEVKDMGRRRLAAFGVPNDAWFVALHVRSSGFYREGAGFIQRHRNASLGSYLPAIRRITQAGGWVIRMGDPSMPPLKRMPKVVDLACNPYWTRSLDIYLWSQARFFLGTTSGPTNAVVSFHTPTLLVNCVSNYAQSWNSRVIFVLKPFWSQVAGRYLKMAEVFTTGFRAKVFNISALAREGVYPESNSAKDILAAVDEMLEYLDNGSLPAMQDPGPLANAPYPLWLWGNAHPSKRFFSAHHQVLID